MKVIDTELPDIKIIEPKLYKDTRGFFFESFNLNSFNEQISNSYNFVQDNHSRSIKNVLRGLHYQLEKPQAKLIRVLNGEIFDVAVDIRQNSPTFGKWVGRYLSSSNNYQMWIPEGFAHGFYVISDYADVCYKTTDFYDPEDERCIVWNDSYLSIEWPSSNTSTPIISSKDLEGDAFNDADYFQ